MLTRARVHTQDLAVMQRVLPLITLDMVSERSVLPVCFCEKEREREGRKERGRERERKRERERERRE